jgi:opacity protein-like surface antigen
MPECLDDYGFYNHFNLKGRPMNVQTTKLSTITIISLLVFTMTANLCIAQEWSRKGKSELFGTLQTMASETVEYSYPDKLPTIQLPVTLEMDSTIIYGFGFGYNFTDHWNINTDMLFGSADTDVKVGNTKVETADMDYILWNINIDYNIWKSRFTPLITCGIGLMDFAIDTTATGVEKVHESNFSSNLGAGVRWDIKDNLLLKLIYRSTWTEVHKADNDQRYDGVSLSVAYMF